MSIVFGTDWDKDILIGRGEKVSKNKEEQKMCHEFSILNPGNPATSVVKVLPGKIMKDCLFGPASTRERVLLYPCSRYRCRIPCPCQSCCRRRLAVASKCNRRSSSCSCNECIELFTDHATFHRLFHFDCKYCDNLVKCFPVFNFWFLNNVKGVVLYDGAIIEFNFAINPLVENCEPPTKPQNRNYYSFYNNYERYKEKALNLNEAGGWMTCETCNFQARTWGQLKEHTLLNHLEAAKKFFHCYKDVKVESHVCQHCEQVFSCQKNLSRHVKKKHYEETHECSVCSESFSRKDNLKRHEVTHGTGSSKYSCDDCGKQFGREDVFVLHMASAHNPGPDFSCRECNSQFSLLSSLERHGKASLNTDGSFKNHCSVCEENFCTSRQLKQHQYRTHVGNTCEDCGEKFSVDYALAKHLKNRNFVTCLECRAILCNLRSLSRHIKQLHKYEKCDECEESFLKEKLKYHKLMKHVDH